MAVAEKQIPTGRRYRRSHFTSIVPGRPRLSRLEEAKAELKKEFGHA
jgi:hypothetical protein